MSEVTPTRGGRGARRRILDAAAELFYRDGINATGVERLATESSVSKRTLYQHFPSKAAVVEAYLHGMEDLFADTVVRPDDDRTPRAQLLATFDSSTTSGGVFRGCPFHNAAVEAAGEMPAVHDIVRTAKLSFAERLAHLAERAGATDPRLLGNQLALLHEGAAALATSLNDPEPWTRAKSAAETLIDAAIR